MRIFAVFLMFGVFMTLWTMSSSDRLQRGKLLSLDIHQRPMPKAVATVLAQQQHMDATELNKQYSYMMGIPIYRSELAKLFLLSSMMFSMVLVFALSRDLRDALVVTSCGAESLAFLKVYGVVPAAAVFMLAYNWLAGVLPVEALFYAVLTPFMLFFVAFAFVLYPMRHTLHNLHWAVPSGGLSYLGELGRHWTFSLYFIISELWGIAGVPLLFWSYAYDVVDVSQARRLYPLVSLLGNLAPIASGYATAATAQYLLSMAPNDEMAFEASLRVLTVLMAGAGLLLACSHHLLRRIHAQEVKQMAMQQACPPPIVSNAPAKSSMSLLQSARLLRHDPYLRQQAMRLLAFGVSIEFTETLWKAAVTAALREKTEYLAFMGRCSLLMGAAAGVMAVFGGRMIRIMGWKTSAVVMPFIIGMLGVPFFRTLTFGDLRNPSVLLSAAYMGLVLNVLSKASKNAILEPIKEISSSSDGKAAVAVVCERVGIVVGAVSLQLMVLLSGNALRSAPSLSVLFYAALLLWARAPPSPQ